jgi:hypothetical protein
MKFRVARHTHHLEPIIQFYTTVVGLEILGSFQNHEGYDGVFLGHPDENWHLEFTVSWQQPLHRPDEDDLLVFYPKGKAEFEAIHNRIQQMNIRLSTPQNPYWKKRGIMVLDPDGFGVIIAQPTE